MSDETEITLSIPVKQAVQAHVEHLQATLTKRNQKIEQLTLRLAEAEAGEPNQRAIQAAYRRGWEEASGQLMETTRKAAASLGVLRKDAFDVYLQAGRENFDGSLTNDAG